MNKSCGQDDTGAEGASCLNDAMDLGGGLGIKSGVGEQDWQEDWRAEEEKNHKRKPLVTGRNHMQTY